MAATVSPGAIATIKRQVYAHWEQDFVAASIASEQLMQQALAHPDAREGALSFIERRPARFQPLGETRDDTRASQSLTRKELSGFSSL